MTLKIHWGRVLGSAIAGTALIALVAWWSGALPVAEGTESGVGLADATALWTLSADKPRAELAGGAKCVSRKIKGPRDCTLTLVFFDEKSCKLEVGSQRAGDKLYIPAWAAQTSAIACCNGGYFQPPKMLPSALEISRGNRTGTLGSSGASGGLAGVRSGKIFIETEAAFKDSADVSELVQCSPMLVHEGKPYVSNTENSRNGRTFIMTDGAGHWAIGVATSASYSGLAAMLTNRQIIPEFKVSMALNLDGGPSSALWWKDVGGSTGQIKESWPVRNILLVLSR